MGHWNHRVCTKTEDEETLYEIHEVYYDDENEIEAWTVNAVKPLGNTLDEIRQELTWMLEAVEQPVLDLAVEAGKLMNKSQ